MNAELIRFIISAILITAGVIVNLVSVLGLYKFSYVLNRMHSGAIGDTLGLLLICLGFAVNSGFNFAAVKILFIPVFFWLSSPVCSHMLGKYETTAEDDDEKKYEEINL